MPDLGAYVRGITLERLETSVRELVHEYHAFWDKYYALLRIRHLAADEGEARFRDARGWLLAPLLLPLAEKIEEMPGEDSSARTRTLAIASCVPGPEGRSASFVR